MGWLVYDTPPRDIPAEIDLICTSDTEVWTVRPLRKSRVGSTWYVAAEVQLKYPDAGTFGYEADAAGRYVICLVILTTRRGGGWGYKALEERAGPRQARAPKSLIGMLSPTDHVHANDWRKACLDHAARPRVQDGDVIELVDPVRFTDGHWRSRFRVRKGVRPGRRRKSTWLVCCETGARCASRGVMARAWCKVN